MELMNELLYSAEEVVTIGMDEIDDCFGAFAEGPSI